MMTSVWLLWSLGCGPTTSSPCTTCTTTTTTTTSTEPTPSTTTTSTTSTSTVPCAGAFPAAWIRGGPDCPDEAVVQVHHYDANTVILRQSLCTSFEAPFLYLFFGNDRALLEDTGAGGIPIASIVQDVVDDWLTANGRNAIPLLVVNSHGHGDHTAGNSALAGLPNTTVVGATVDDLVEAFGINNWPNGRAEIDLGGRVVDLVPIPGHQSAHVALYDRPTGLLLTGDTLYPGRLYIADFPVYRQSLHTLLDFTADQHVCHVLGTHIEMSETPGDDYAFGATFHPDERALELGIGHLEALSAAVDAMGNTPVRETHDDFIIYPL